MFRYVAFAWNRADRRQCVQARALQDRLSADSRDWHLVLAADGLAVLTNGTTGGPSDVCWLPERAGVVLGALFERGNVGVSRAVGSQLSAAQAACLVNTQGRALIDNYWGQYVALLYDRETDTSRVIRDPTARLPCLTLHRDGVDVYLSWLEDALTLGGEFTVNWSYLRAALCYQRLQVRETGIQEVSQVLNGECISRRGDQLSSRFYWSPFQLGAPLDAGADAVAELRRTIGDCVQAWARGRDRIVHMLSGGLDSSIVLAHLASLPTRPSVTALNLHSQGSSTDEREIARIAAARTGFPLIERERDSTIRLMSLTRIHPSATPGNYLFSLDRKVQTDMAEECGAQTLMTGWGGDQVFYQSQGVYGAAENLRRHGVRPHLFTVAMDAARMDRSSVWRVLREALREVITGARWSPLEEVGRYRYLIRTEVLEETRKTERFTHPWFQSVDPSVPGGKIWHAYQLIQPLEFYHPLQRASDPDLLTPLFSQPLFELVLRIAIYLHIELGWDRAVARRASVRDIPLEIILRQAKGSQDDYVRNILLRDLTFARELLLDGRLVKEGVVHRRKLEDALSPRALRVQATTSEIYDCLSTEIWLRALADLVRSRRFD